MKTAFFFLPHGISVERFSIHPVKRVGAVSVWRYKYRRPFLEILLKNKIPVLLPLPTTTATTTIDQMFHAAVQTGFRSGLGHPFRLQQYSVINNCALLCNNGLQRLCIESWHRQNNIIMYYTYCRCNIL